MRQFLADRRCNYHLAYLRQRPKTRLMAWARFAREQAPGRFAQGGKYHPLAPRHVKHYCTAQPVGAADQLADQTRGTVMEKPKRSYYLPGKLVDAFDKEASKGGYVKEKIVASAMLAFLDSDANTRAKTFDRLDRFLSSKKK